jgi:hypothetical protein
MATPNANPDVFESPRKRQKLSPPPPGTATSLPQQDISMQNSGMTGPEPTHSTSKMRPENGFQLEREAQVGITHFVSMSKGGFEGILKQRYVDSVTLSHVSLL